MVSTGFNLCDDSPRLKPRASGMTLVCRPTPSFEASPMSEHSSKINSCIAWHTKRLTRQCFYPQPKARGTRTLFSCLCAKELKSV